MILHVINSTVIFQADKYDKYEWYRTGRYINLQHEVVASIIMEYRTNIYLYTQRPWTQRLYCSQQRHSL